jgi:hypothetical protein
MSTRAHQLASAAEQLKELVARFKLAEQADQLGVPLLRAA